MDRLIQLWHCLGPAMPHPKAMDALRSGLGAVVGLGVTALLLWLLDGAGRDLLAQPLLIAPFGASTYLIFAVPNSPLAQPWSAVVGNTVSAIAALALLRVGLPMMPTAALAVGLAVLAMAALRAMHPPGGAVALAIVLAASSEHLPSIAFALFPVATGTTALVMMGMLWNTATGRHYPFRQPAAPVPLPDTNTSLPATLLAATLSRLRLDANLGVADLARLIEAAESEALTRKLGPITAADVMTRDPIWVSPETTLFNLTALFRKHGFKTLPIHLKEGSFGGLVSQQSLIGIAEPTLTAADLADPLGQTVAPQTPLSDLLTLIIEIKQQILPVVQDGRLVGLITRSDMIALLSGHRPH
ncbi:MAG: HPP family protein [Cypionkella sp.]